MKPILVAEKKLNEHIWTQSWWQSKDSTNAVQHGFPSDRFRCVSFFHKFDFYSTMLLSFSRRNVNVSQPSNRPIALLICALTFTVLTLYDSIMSQGYRHLAALDHHAISFEDEAIRRFRRETYLHHNIGYPQDTELQVKPCNNNCLRKRRAVSWSFLPFARAPAQSCPAPSPTPPLPGKKGIGFTLYDEGKVGSWTENMPRVKELKVGWNYSWNWKRIPQQIDSSEFIPMIWGPWYTQEVLNDYVVSQHKAGLTKRLLGFNEPDMEEQAHMSVQEAADRWGDLENTGLPLTSPSFAHWGGTWSKDWFKKTDELCLRQEIAATHWYYGPNATQFQRDMRTAYELYGGQRPLLITEFAVADWSAHKKRLEDNRYSREQVLEFAKIVIPWMEQQDCEC
jgi:Glycosyl hydrolase catalytic core